MSLPDEWSVCLELSTICPPCGAIQPLNSPQLEITCRKCGEVTPYSKKFWRSVVGDCVDGARAKEERNGYACTSMGPGPRPIKEKYFRLRPRCIDPDCKTYLEADAVESGTTGTVPCPGCTRQFDTFPAPDWLREVIWHADQLFIPVSEASAASQTGADAPAEPVLQWYLRCRVNPESVAEIHRRGEEIVADVHARLKDAGLDTPSGTRPHAAAPQPPAQPAAPPATPQAPAQPAEPDTAPSATETPAPTPDETPAPTPDETAAPTPEEEPVSYSSSPLEERSMVPLLLGLIVLGAVALGLLTLAYLYVSGSSDDSERADKKSKKFLW